MKKAVFLLLFICTTSLASNAQNYSWNVPYDSRGVSGPYVQSSARTPGSGYYGTTIDANNYVNPPKRAYRYYNGYDYYEKRPEKPKRGKKYKQK